MTKNRVERLTITDFKSYYEVTGNKNFMGLTKVQTCKLVEQKRESRNRPMHI